MSHEGSHEINYKQRMTIKSKSDRKKKQLNRNKQSGYILQGFCK